MNNIIFILDILVLVTIWIIIFCTWVFKKLIRLEGRIVNLEVDLHVLKQDNGLI